MQESGYPDCPSAAELEALVRGEAAPLVRDHVQRCTTCSRRLAEVEANEELMQVIVASDLSSIDPSHPTGSLPPGPDALPGYAIESQLHEGAQGVVYRATQLATKRVVALKVLGAGAFATTRQRRRFEREVDLVAGLTHPNIVTVHDSGVTPDGRHWFAMEYVDGRTLDRWVAANEAPPLPTLLELFSGICRALHYAHQRGVIHRDLKPGNIMVDEGDQPHLVDFGLAKPIDPTIGDDQATVTRAGAFLGTVAYASPEQASGDPMSIDVRSDVYALGVILYELLTASLPYPISGSLSSILDVIANTPAQPPRSVASARYRIDDELETIVLEALAKEPARRYQSAADLGRDIDHYLKGEAIDAKRDSMWYVLRKTIARHKAAVAVVATFVLLLIGSTVALSIMNRRIAGEKEKLYQVNLFLEDTLGSVEGAAGQDAVTVAELLDEGEHWIDLVFRDQPEIESAVRAIIGNGYRNLNRLPEAERQLERSLKTLEAVHGADHPDVARALNALALLRRDQERLDEATELLEQSLIMRRRLGGADDLAVALNLGNLALVRRAAGDDAQAEVLLEESLAIRRRLRGAKHPDVAMCQFHLANLYEDRGQRERSIALHREVLAVRLETLQPPHPDIPRSQLALARLLIGSGQAEEALPLLTEATRMTIDLRGEHHWRVGEARIALGDCLLQLALYKDAERELGLAYRMLQETVGSEHEQTQAAIEELVALYEAWERPEDAARYRDLLPD